LVIDIIDAINISTKTTDKANPQLSDSPAMYTAETKKPTMLAIINPPLKGAYLTIKVHLLNIK
jgi:hypothetical protein